MISLKKNKDFFIKIIMFYLLKIDKDLKERRNLSNFLEFKVVSSYKEFRKVYSLVYERYLNRGLVSLDRDSFLAQEFYNLSRDGYDLRKRVVLYAEYNEKVLATVTPIFSEYTQLPSFWVYRDVIENLLSSGRKVVEFSRLASTFNLSVLMRLFRLAFRLSLARGYNDLLIEVHPRHGVFYERFFLFEKIGDYKELPHLNGAPAILFRLNLDNIQERIYNAFSDLPMGKEYCNFFFKKTLPEDYLLTQLYNNSYGFRGVPNISLEDKNRSSLSESKLVLT